MFQETCLSHLQTRACNSKRYAEGADIILIVAESIPERVYLTTKNKEGYADKKCMSTCTTEIALSGFIIRVTIPSMMLGNLFS